MKIDTSILDKMSNSKKQQMDFVKKQFEKPKEVDLTSLAIKFAKRKASLNDNENE
jgi:hypothetical protein